jgi:hypothetical protein
MKLAKNVGGIDKVLRLGIGAVAIGCGGLHRYVVAGGGGGHYIFDGPFGAVWVVLSYRGEYLSCGEALRY